MKRQAISKMLLAEEKRRSQLIKTLCELSRNGWANAMPSDYEPLERELAQIFERSIGAQLRIGLIA